MTNFKYNRNTPDGPNNPSSDQPLMEENTNSIQDIIAVDHITLAVNNGGEHKAIHFNIDTSYVPVPPVSPPQLFIKTMAPNAGIGSLPELFYYSGNAAQSSTQYYNTSVASYSTFLFGGMIIKGGTFIGNNPNPVVTAYAAAFPNATLGVFITPVTNGAGINFPSVIAKTAASFTTAATTVGTVWQYLAIGY